MRINVNSITRRVEVDNRIPLRYYYRIADNLLKQFGVRNNTISSGLPGNTSKRKSYLQEGEPERLIAVLDELESLKPEFQHRVNELNRAHGRAQLVELDSADRTSYGAETSSLEWPIVDKTSHSSMDTKRVQNLSISILPAWQFSLHWRNNNDRTQVSSSSSVQLDKQFQRLSVNLPLPNKETLSRHSFLGPNGLRGQWLGPSVGTKVQYPSSTDLSPNEDTSLNQAGPYDMVPSKVGDSGGAVPTMESVLSLDDGRWLKPAEDLCPPMVNEAREDPFQFVSIKQPSPPPVLAQVQQEFAPISPSKVADPRPGPAKPSQDGTLNSSSYQHLHVVASKIDARFLEIGSGKYRKKFRNLWHSCWFAEKQGFPYHYTHYPKAGVNI
ncbi:hypothetical protein Patl1_24936 [Pistacia atlantica]|uniref:Uncharacterized protein n=1 Tax=Pistacia atlantica TaxID=434234 RepID=A0ACC1B2N1_9ROSI|nr:hypothetical protein Patl1_24936 [Pistacia atlantica]